MKQSILFFCASFATGGVEKVLVNLANHFSNNGYPTSFLVCKSNGDLREYLNKNIEVHCFNKRLASSLRSALCFFHSSKADTIICGPQFINILAILSVKLFLRRKVKLIITHHSFYDLDVKQMRFLHLFYKLLIRVFYNSADVIVAVSNAVKDHLVYDIGLPVEKIEVIYNPVIDENLSVLKDEMVSHKWITENKDFKIIVCVGRLSKVKNQSDLINLMPDLLKYLSCKLIIIGTGEEEELLKALVSKLNLQENIDFIGSVANPIKFIFASDLLVIPSISETFSLVAVESIAVGTPVLSTPTLGVLEILENCEGCFFAEIENRSEFTDKIKQILITDKVKVDQPFVDKFNVATIGTIYERLVLILNRF